MLNSLTGQKNNKTASVYCRCIHGAWRGCPGRVYSSRAGEPPPRRERLQFLRQSGRNTRLNSLPGCDILDFCFPKNAALR